MRFVFVYYAFEDQGSGLVIQGYTEAARALGHEVVVHGRSNPRIPLNYSLHIDRTDAVIFIFEWTTQLRYGDQLDLVRLVSKVPRERRVIIDGDGNYNDLIRVSEDYNHRDAEASRRWIEICDSLSDKICQPTLHPRRVDVRPFLFYAYNPAWERPLQLDGKAYGMVYVGHSKFRWRPMQRVLRAIGPVREQIGPIALVGNGWDALPWWAEPLQLEDAYYADTACLERLGIEVRQPVPFEQVIDWMGKAVFNPVISRPLFDELRFVTPRLFETPAANTIPLFGLPRQHVHEIYGEAALALLLPDDRPDEKVRDVVARPEAYLQTVREIRQHLTERHSHTERLRELIEIVES